MCLMNVDRCGFCGFFSRNYLVDKLSEWGLILELNSLRTTVGCIWIEPPTMGMYVTIHVGIIIGFRCLNL